MNDEPLNPSTMETSGEPHTTTNTEFHSFACNVPLDTLASEGEDPSPVTPNILTAAGDVGVVGTITVLGRTTVMIWLGWGKIQEKLNSELEFDSNNTAASGTPLSTNIVGSASNRIMGPLIVSLPRTKYQGAFSEDTPPSSKLIPSEDMESELLASHMASRLSQQLQMAVFVSCHFENDASEVGESVERYMLRRRAMTLAEERICQILKPSSM